jgi:hypothetical protein
VDGLKTLSRYSEEFEEWQSDSETALRRVFGETSHRVKDFTGIRYSLMMYSSGTPEYRFDEVFREGLATSQAMLRSCITEVEEYFSDDADATAICRSS